MKNLPLLWEFIKVRSYHSISSIAKKPNQNKMMKNDIKKGRENWTRGPKLEFEVGVLESSSSKSLN